MLSQLSQPGAPLSLYPFISSLTPVHFQHIKEIHLKCIQISSLQNPTVASHFLNSKIKLFRHDLPLTTSLSVQSHLLLVDSYTGQDALASMPRISARFTPSSPSDFGLNITFLLLSDYSILNYNLHLSTSCLLSLQFFSTELVTNGLNIILLILSFFFH